MPGRNGTPRPMTLAKGVEPDRPFPVPAPELFEGKDFRGAFELQSIGEAIIASGAFDWHEGEEPRITYLWKLAGGQSKGNATWGKCIKLSGLAGYFDGEADFVIWLAADWLLAARATYLQVEAIVFHELSHIAVKEDKDGDFAGWGVTGHDFEGFATEVARYGMYRPSVARMASAFQAALPLGVDDVRDAVKDHMNAGGFDRDGLTVRA